MEDLDDEMGVFDVFEDNLHETLEMHRRQSKSVELDKKEEINLQLFQSNIISKSPTKQKISGTKLNSPQLNLKLVQDLQEVRHS